MTTQKLTRKEIVKLKAGSEMDRLIAEMVMGWTHVSKDHQWNYFTNMPCYGWPKEYYGAPPEADIRPDLEANWHRVPDYSTDIGPAWRIVKKLKESMIVRVESYRDHATAGIAYLTSAIEPDFLSSFATADTVELAICRAALIAALEDK